MEHRDALTRIRLEVVVHSTGRIAASENGIQLHVNADAKRNRSLQIGGLSRLHVPIHETTKATLLRLDGTYS